MLLTINGERIEMEGEQITVADLLATKQLTGSPCAVEVNQTLVPKRDHDTHVLSDGDRVEIVTLVGGG